MRLADQQMKVLGDDYVAQHNELIAETHLFENSQEQLATPRRPKQRLTPIATASKEMQVSRARRSSALDSTVYQAE